MGHTRSFILQKLGEAFDKDKVLYNVQAREYTLAPRLQYHIWYIYVYAFRYAVSAGQSSYPYAQQMW